MITEFFNLGDILNIKTGKLDANASSSDGQYSFFTCSKEPLRISSYSFDCECVLVAGNGDLNVKYYHGKFDAYQRTYILESKDKKKLDVKYLYHFMSKYIEILRQQSVGGVIKYIKMENLTKAKIPLPPLPEQRRIADILDRADALRTKRREAIEHINALTQSIFLEMFGDPVTNPKGWQTKKLGDISEVKIGPFGSLLHKEDYVEDGIPLINPSHIVDLKVLPEIGLTVGKRKYNTLKSYVMKTNDVVLGRRGEMGRCALITEKENGYICGTGSLFIRPSNQLNSLFLVYLLSSAQIKQELDRNSLGVTMKNLNVGIVSNLKVICPNISLQNKFQMLQKEMNELLNKQINASKITESLFVSIQHNAFNSELINKKLFENTSIQTKINKINVLNANYD